MRTFIFLGFLMLATKAFAADLPTGTFKAIAFKVEKGPTEITDRQLHVFEGTVTITKLANDRYEMIITARLQMTPSTPLREDTRRDVFTVTWETERTGRLVNTAVNFQRDESKFTIDGGKLIIRSWIARNQLWETHTYQLTAAAPACAGEIWDPILNRTRSC